MMSGYALLLVPLAFTTPAGGDPGAPPPEVFSRRWDFDAPAPSPPFAAAAHGETLKRKDPPEIREGRLRILESWWRSDASVAFPAPAPSAVKEVDLSWTLVMHKGTEGVGLAWLDAGRHGTEGPAPEVEAWEAPSLAGCFGVGFDAVDPPNQDPFRGSGNLYDRPQHEVSLHWDGREIVKRVSPVDFRDGKPRRVAVRLRFRAGGALVTVRIDGRSVYDRYFLPAMTAYAGRPAFGARNGETAGDAYLDDLEVTLRDPVPAPAPPLLVTAFDGVLNDKDHPRNTAEVSFPEDTDGFARILCTLRLDNPGKRFDPWDRLARLWVYGEKGERFELLRYITPYGRGFAWTVDVTDFRPLLRGRRKVEQACGTYGEGWKVTVRFAFYPGEDPHPALRVINLWCGNPEIGNPEKPVSAFYTPKAITLDPRTAAARVRLTVTGHGMLPNTDNAGEFMPIGRTLFVNDRSFRNRLWKKDNYLNPCRPQGGTWKYDRAGWAPGDVVRPWTVDATPLLDGSRALRLAYVLDPYLNEGRGKTWAPTHTTESQLVFYGLREGGELRRPGGPRRKRLNLFRITGCT